MREPLDAGKVHHAELHGLPGAEWVEQGLADLAAARNGTVPALVVAIASTRLRRLGLPVPPHEIREPELKLYALIEKDDPRGAHSRYNACLRQLVSFARALELEQGRNLRKYVGYLRDKRGQDPDQVVRDLRGHGPDRET